MANEQFISAEEYEAQEAVAVDHGQVIEIQDWETAMEAIADRDTTRLVIPRNKDFSRKQVVEAFHSAFELIGGVPRLALWGHQHETEFYKLYSKLLPSQASSALGEANELVIRHVLPRGALDE